MNTRVTVKEAAELMGTTQQFIRICMHKDKLPIGTAVQMSGSKWTYFISRSLLNKYIGMEE